MRTGSDPSWWQFLLVIIAALGLAFPKFGHKIGIRRQDPSDHRFWRFRLFCGIFLSLILIIALIGVNSMQHATGKWSANLGLGIMLFGSVFVIVRCTRQLKSLR